MALRRVLSWPRLALLFAMLLSTAGSLPSGIRSIDEPPLTLPLPSHKRDTCPPFVGNSDLYGLGIRLGVYFQLIATLLANYFQPEVYSDTLYTNTMFIAAVFLAVLRAAVTNQLEPFEGVIMLQLLLGFLLSVIAPMSSIMWGFASMVDDYGAARVSKETRLFVRTVSEYTTLRLLAGDPLHIAIACFQVFFWFSFVQHTECDQHVFLFAKVSLGPPVIRAFQAFAALYMLYPFASFWAMTVPIVSRAFRRAVLAAFRVKSWNGAGRLFVEGYLAVSAKQDQLELVSGAEVEEDNRETGQRWRESRYARYLNRMLSMIRVLGISYGLIIIVWSILSVELTLVFNSVTDINYISTTGQLIPFVIGLVGLLRTMHQILVRILREKFQKMHQILTVDRSTGVFKYCLRNGRIAQFSSCVEGEKRRRSLDPRSARTNPKRAHLPLSKSSDAETMPPPQLVEPRPFWFEEPRTTFVQFHNGDTDTEDDDEDEAEKERLPISERPRSVWSMLSQLTDTPAKGVPRHTTNAFDLNSCVFRSPLRDKTLEMEFYQLRSGRGQAFVKHNQKPRRRASTGNMPIYYGGPSPIAEEKLKQLRSPEARLQMRMQYWQRDREDWRNMRSARKRWKRAQAVPGSTQWNYTLAGGRKLELACPNSRDIARGWRRDSWNGVFIQRKSTAWPDDSSDTSQEDEDGKALDQPDEPKTSLWSRVRSIWRWTGISREPEFEQLSYGRVSRVLLQAYYTVVQAKSCPDELRQTPTSKPHSLLAYIGLSVLQVMMAALNFLWLPLEAAVWGDLRRRNTRPSQF